MKTREIDPEVARCVQGDKPKSIYVYTIPNCHEFSLVIPKGAVFLCVSGLPMLQEPRIWFLVDRIGEIETQNFKAFQTNVEFVGDMQFLATFFTEGGCVWHLFKDNTPKE